MSAGIVCKVWNISGDTKSKTTKGQITDSVGYILNEEKTEVHLQNPNSIEFSAARQLGREIKYVENDIKTLEGALIGNVNLFSSNIQDAVSEMMEIKEFYDKKDGRAALHGMISLSADESNIGNASNLMCLCEEMLKEIFPNHQAIFAIHTNTDDLHVHFIVNSVGLNGRKIHQNNEFISNVVQPCVNRLALKYGFTPNEQWQNKKKNLDAYALLKISLRKQIDIAIENSNSYKEFIANMEAAGFTVNTGKYISLRNKSMQKSVRTHNLGCNYTKDSIINRISTRKSAFENIEIQNFSIQENSVSDIFTPNIVWLKKYKELDPIEKKKIIKLLKEGRNPWRENREGNWQLNNIANELNLFARVHKMVSTYSANNSVEEALEEILKLKIELSDEKRKIKTVYAKYRPIIDIYKEIKKYERKAFLYEKENLTEYRLEFEKYRELTRRLEDGYNKNVLEVSDFMNRYEDQLLLLSSQIEELSSEYRDIKNYAKKNGTIMQPKSLKEVIGYVEDKDLAKVKNFTVEEFYLASASSDVVVKVLKMPRVRNGVTYEAYEVDVMDSTGKIISHIDNVNDPKEFLDRLHLIEQKYDLKLDKKMNRQDAMDFAKNVSRKNGGETIKEKNTDVPASKKTYSFTQGINLKSVGMDSGIHVIANSENPQFYGVVISGEEIQLKIIDSDGSLKDEYLIPGFRKRNNAGFETLCQIQAKYDFSNELYSFDSLDEAKTYFENNTLKPRR